MTWNKILSFEYIHISIIIYILLFTILKLCIDKYKYLLLYFDGLGYTFPIKFTHSLISLCTYFRLNPHCTSQPFSQKKKKNYNRGKNWQTHLHRHYFSLFLLSLFYLQPPLYSTASNTIPPPSFIHIMFDVHHHLHRFFVTILLVQKRFPTTFLLLVRKASSSTSSTPTSSLNFWVKKKKKKTSSYGTGRMIYFSDWTTQFNVS